MMGIISYAQNYEDVLLWRVLKDVNDGFYIDVGANDPVELSVTKWFYDQGWHGINMEPLDVYFQRLCNARPRDINLRQVAGAKREKLTFYDVAGGGLSTTSREIAEGYRERGIPVDGKEVEVVPLRDICEEYAHDREIHFLKVDTEGNEFDVLRGMDFQKFRPWILVVEATLPCSTVLSVDFDEMIRGQSYEFSFFDGLNYYYVAKEKAEAFGSKLSIPANVFDDFVQADKVQLTQQRDVLKQRLAQMTQELEKMKKERKSLKGDRETAQVEDAGSIRLKGAGLE